MGQEKYDVKIVQNIMTVQNLEDYLALNDADVYHISYLNYCSNYTFQTKYTSKQKHITDLISLLLQIVSVIIKHADDGVRSEHSDGAIKTYVTRTDGHVSIQLTQRGRW